ncbi:MAG: hypothetical protein A2X47_03745 [Lentisphaerae bacterium GWF2_38_69]|nr:MAG: hypothetical protein A2X47_03745 [Lentisphaerae bacterium GWF2_38_69]
MTRSVVRYSEAFKLKVVNELESGKFSGTDEARKSYGIKDPATVIFPFSTFNFQFSIFNFPFPNWIKSVSKDYSLLTRLARIFVMGLI